MLRRTEPPRPAPARLLPSTGLVDLVRGVVSEGGALWIQVTGISMNPLLREGDAVLLARLARPPRRGDVVFLDVDGRPLLHRVRRVAAAGLVTGGDAAQTDDPLVPPAACVAHALAARRGTITVALTPTLAFGIAPLLWFTAWAMRTRIPASMDRGVKPLARAIVRALS